MKAITARKGVVHITPQMDAMWHQGILETESCIFDAYEKLAAEIISNNEVRIRSGVGMIQGRFFCVEPNTYESVAISNGTQGENRIDLIVARWSVDAGTETENVTPAVIQGASVAGTPSTPNSITGELDNGALMADFPLYEVRVEGINIIALTPLFDTGWIVSNETLNAFADAGLPIT